MNTVVEEFALVDVTVGSQKHSSAMKSITFQFAHINVAVVESALLVLLLVVLDVRYPAQSSRESPSLLLVIVRELQ